MNDLFTSEKQHSRASFRIGAIFLLGLLIFILIGRFCDTSLSQDEVEKKIMSSERLQRVNKICAEIPKPKDFNLVYRNIGGNSYTTSVGYQFNSKLGFEEVKQFFVAWFVSNNWVLNDLNTDISQGYFTYKVANFRISIANGSFSNSNYSISCSEEY